MVSGYESRSSPYPSAKVFLARFGTVSDWIHPEAVNPPFAVELFTVGCFGPSPDAVTHPVVCVAADELPARAGVERAAVAPGVPQTAPNPAGGLAARARSITHFD